MATPVHETAAMIAGMAPVRDPATWHFCTVADAAGAALHFPEALAIFREAEGISLVLDAQAAARHGFDTGLPMARITLSMHSALDGVGLTAAVARALAGAGIPCNMVAAYHHDHAFVPLEDADRAMAVLQDLSQRGAP
ncbi:ACT domain-containing protein [Roseovarius salis]|uniref:ACT domain-containing protein n=1 Tax=Roseovarius salis TaxID=3376063 RepID=UPI0037C69FBE